MSSTNKPGIAFWIIGIVGLVWNSLGVHGYIQQAFKTEGFLETYNAEQLALMGASPAWITACFAIAVFAGALGCISLLMRKKIATTLFALSFIAALIQMCYGLFMTDSRELFDMFQGTIMPIMIIVFAAFLMWYSKDQKGKGVLS